MSRKFNKSHRRFQPIPLLTVMAIFSMVYAQTGLAQAQVQSPSLKFKMGQFFTKVSAGSAISDEPLNSMVTLQPSVLWNFSSFRSRMGFHFLTDLSSSFGLMPISGIGFSGYFYPWGISSAYETTLDNVVQQTYKSGPFVFASFTPVNLNINKTNQALPDSSTSFSAFIFESMLGAGYDYAFRANVIFSAEIGYRFGDSIDNNFDESQEVTYSGFGLFLGFTTTYF